MGLIITLALGAFVALGALVSYLTRSNHKVVQISIALALGTLSTLALVELIPEAIEHLGDSSALSIILGAAFGLIFLLVLDKFLPDHDGAGEGHGHSHSHGHDHASHNTAHIGIISAIAVTLHNVIEGMAVYSIAEQSPVTGLMVAIGVGLHNIPMGMVIYATLKDRKKERAAMLLLATFSTFFGGLLMALLWGFIGENMIGILISVTLGMILYIVFFELIPSVVHDKSWKTSLPAVAAGVLIILISTMVE